MKIIIPIFLLSLFYLNASAQGSDFILLKKNNHTIKTYYTGQSIEFGTASGAYNAEISGINKDSIYFTQYDIKQIPTNLGIYVLDTVARYKLRFNYHEIAYIGRKPANFNWAASGATLIGGGIVLTTVGLGTWLFTKPGTQYYASPALVIGSAALAGIGFLILKSNHSYKIGPKYHLEYVSTSGRKK